MPRLTLCVKICHARCPTAWSFTDQTPFTHRNHIKFGPVGPPVALKVGALASYGNNKWVSNPGIISAGATDFSAITLPYICKKSPFGAKAPCACSGDTDADALGGHCKAWSTTSAAPWDTAWCYVSPSCARGIFNQAQGYTRAHCVDKTAPPPPTPAPQVTTQFPPQASACPAKQFQKDSSTCADCKTGSSCTSGQTLSREYGDICGETVVAQSVGFRQKSLADRQAEVAAAKGYGRGFLSPNGVWGNGLKNYKDSDFTCCTTWEDKAATCAASGQGVTPKIVGAEVQCKAGQDFSCQKCPDGQFWPKIFDSTRCSSAAFKKNGNVCKCQPCNAKCDTCEDFPTRCLSCQFNASLFFNPGTNDCIKDCSQLAQSGGKKYSQSRARKLLPFFKMAPKILI